MMGEFLLFNKNTDIKSYFLRGFKISKELTKLSDNVYKFVKETTHLKYYFE